MKKILCLATLSAGLILPIANAAVTENYSFTTNQVLPDGNPSGWADLRTLSSQITSINDVSVTLNISGSWSGDIYATLQHSSGFAVLLNRVGRTAGNAFGSGDDGFQITLNDLGSLADVHNALSGGGGALVGNFSSDGRNVDPDFVTDASPRTAQLDSMVGLDASGDWTLFVADLSGGDGHSVDSWSLEITGVPEPGTVTLLVLGAGLLARRRRG